MNLIKHKMGAIFMNQNHKIVKLPTQRGYYSTS